MKLHQNIYLLLNYYENRGDGWWNKIYEEGNK